MPFHSRVLGRSGLETGAIGLASSYGAPADAVPFAYDHGVRYFYWGSRRTSQFAEGLETIRARRET